MRVYFHLLKPDNGSNIINNWIGGLVLLPCLCSALKYNQVWLHQGWYKPYQLSMSCISSQIGRLVTGMYFDWRRAHLFLCQLQYREVPPRVYNLLDENGPDEKWWEVSNNWLFHLFKIFMISAIALQLHLDAGVMRFYFGGKKSFCQDWMYVNKPQSTSHVKVYVGWLSVFLLGGGDSETGHVA